MDYMFCIPAAETATRENCEKIHNILARMSDKYKLKITPVQAKVKQAPASDYYRKYRIYKQICDKEEGGDVYLQKDEEEMILSVCKNRQEQELMKSCIYGYCYPASMILKSFREDAKPRMEKKK